MQELCLARIGATIEPTQALDDDAGPPRDRLAELAGWWVRVSTAPAPARPQHFWAPDQDFEPPAGQSTAETIAWAVTATDTAIDAGADLLLLTVPSDPGACGPAILGASLLGLDAVDAAGWPSATGISDIAWMVTVTTIRDGLQRLRGPYPDGAAPGAGAAAGPEDLLTRLGDRPMAAGCAVLIRSAARRTPVLLDGAGAAACALLAHRVNPAALDWFQIADGPLPAPAPGTPPATGDLATPGMRDPLQDRVLTALQREPMLRLGLRAADGTGGRLGLHVLQAALARAARA